MNFNLSLLLKLTILLALTGSIQLARASESGNNAEKWQLAKSNDGISLFYRWIKSEDGNKYRQLKANFTIQAGIEEILTQFTNQKNYVKWAAGIRDCDIKQLSDSLWCTYSVMNYPFPLKQKDLVTLHQIQTHTDCLVININAAPELISEINGIERIKNYSGRWEFIIDSNDNISVDCRLTSFEKPKFPRFIQDPVIQNIMIKSFSRLKIQTENCE